MASLRKRGAIAYVAITSTAVLLSGCSSDAPSESKPSAAESSAAVVEKPPSDAGAEVVVWVDAPRKPQIDAYAKANPGTKIRTVVIPPDAGYVSTKVSLANRANKGWPDLVFVTGGETASLSVAPLEFSQPLNGLVPEETIAGFTPGTLEQCTYEGKLHCLQNDLAQSVLWYNAKLMKDFGYEVPKTFEEFGQIGVKLGQEHPGYIVGTLSGRYGAGTYFGSSGCPTRETEGQTVAKIDTSDPRCTRVVDILAPLVENKTLSLLDPFDPGLAKLGNENKILMFPEASWFGDFALNPFYKIPAGQIAAAPMPTWPGETNAYSGTTGGGAFVVSKHAKNMEGAIALAAYLTTDVALQSKQPTYPAHQASAEAWLKAKTADEFYAEDPSPALQAQAALINPNFDYVRYEAQWADSFNRTVVESARKGNLAEGVKRWQDALVSAAKSSGYEVK